MTKISKEGELINYNVKMGIIKVRKNLYCDNLCMYIKAPKPRRKIEVGSRIPLILKTDIVNLTIKAIIK